MNVFDTIMKLGRKMSEREIWRENATTINGVEIDLNVSLSIYPMHVFVNCAEHVFILFRGLQEEAKIMSKETEVKLLKSDYWKIPAKLSS